MNSTVKRSLVLALSLALVAGVVTSSHLATQRAHGAPSQHAGVLSISSNPPAATPQDFLAAIDLTYRAGARGNFMSWTWKTLEPSAGRFDLAEVKDGLNYLGNVRGFDLLVGLQVINTTAKETPSNLANIPFDAPAMKRRFHALVDALRPSLNRHVKYLSIGNEVDVYLSTHPGEWTAYTAFYNDGVAYLHAIVPWIKVGVTVTYDGAVNDQGHHIQILNGNSDVYILTYYPLGARFKPRNPDSPRADIPKMVRLANRRPLILQEVGYPSSPVLSSSERKQAEFVTHVFSAWRATGNQIPFLNIFLLHDLPVPMCDELAKYYGLPRDKNFHAFLCSLGLRGSDGKPKLAWTSLVDGARSMGLK